MSLIQKVRNIKNLELSRDERGLSTVEYVILLVVIAALCVAAWRALGNEVQGKLNSAKGQISTETNIEGAQGNVE